MQYSKTAKRPMLLEHLCVQRRMAHVIALCIMVKKTLLFHGHNMCLKQFLIKRKKGTVLNANGGSTVNQNMDLHNLTLGKFHDWNHVYIYYVCHCAGNEQIQRLPSKYVLRRYTRNARIGLPCDRNDTVQTDPRWHIKRWQTLQHTQRSLCSYQRGGQVNSSLLKSQDRLQGT